jgi:murein DD-endopeptidase MepM/ murein hydrolase activator NlpD
MILPKFFRTIGLVGGAVLVVLLLSGECAARHYLISLKTRNGNYLTAEQGGGGIINANRLRANEWETFTLLDLNEGELEDGDKVAIKTMNGNFFSAVNGGGDNVFADKRAPLEWETFFIERKMSRVDKRIEDRDFIALRSINNYYLSAPNGGGAQAVNAKTKTFGADEKFFLERKGEPSAGRLSGPFSAPQMIVRGVVGNDESGRTTGDFFDCKNSYFGDGFPNCYLDHEGTDFMLFGHIITQLAGSIDVYTVAPGKVVAVADGNTDKCFYKPSSPDSKDVIFCVNDVRNGREFISEQKDANMVAVLQDDGLIAYYFHLKRDSIVLRKDQRVECGQLVGKIGSSGRSSAPHFHLTLARIKHDQPFPATNPNAADPDIEFKNASFNRTLAGYLNPYNPMLWISLSGVVPKKTCSSYVEGASPTCGLGQPCPNNLCQPGLLMKDGVCKRIGVLPSKPCDGNQLCLPGLECTGGVCKLPPPKKPNIKLP